VPSASTLAAFAGASLVLLAIPGPAVLFIVALTSGSYGTLGLFALRSSRHAS